MILDPAILKVRPYDMLVDTPHSVDKAIDTRASPVTALQEARRYVEAGFSVIPCLSRDKQPAIAWHEYQQRRPTDAQLTAWFADGKEHNLAIVTGAVSGLTVLDVDGDEGTDSVAGKELPPTPCVKTAKGTHYYYRHPGFAVHNFARKLPGLDLRGDGGYVVAPPSVHPSGRHYEWSLGLDVPLAPMPAWLLELVETHTEKSTETHADWFTNAWAGVREGERNDMATRLAGLFRRWGCGRDQALVLLLSWNQRNAPPLSEEELERTLDSVWRYPGPESVGVRLFSLTELAQIADSVEWLWQGWIPRRAVTTMVAKAGIGKTLLACAFTCALVATGRWPDGTRAETGRVLYVDGEAGAGELRDKLRYVGRTDLNSPSVRVMYSPSGGYICADARWPDVEQAWREYGPDLVVFDPLTQHHRRDSRSAVAMRMFFSRIMSVAQETRAAVLVLHHPRKRGVTDLGKIDLDRVADSRDIVAASRSVLTLEPEDGSDDLRLTCLKSNFASRPEPLGIRIGEDGLLWLGEVQDKETVGATEQAVAWLRDLLNSGPKAAKEVEALASRAGISSSTLRRAKKQLGVNSRKTASGWIWHV